MSQHKIDRPDRQAAQDTAQAHDRHSADDVQRLTLLAALGVRDTDAEPGFDAPAQAAASLTAARLLADLSAQVPGVIFQLLRDAQGRLSLPYLSQRVVDLCELQVGQVMHSARALLRRCRPGHAARLLRALQRSAAAMTVWQETVPVRLPQAGLRVLQVHAQPRPADGGGVLWHGLLTDITDQLRADAQLQQLIQTEVAAVKAAEIRRDLLSRVSHEFRTPLNAILGFSQLMRIQGASLSLASVLVSVQHIEQAGTHLLALVNDLLDLSAEEAGRTDLHLQALRLAPLVEQTIDLRSGSGQGSRSRVSLPADARARALARASSVAAPAVPPAHHATVVYIEDNPVNALLMTAIFEAAALAHLRLVVAVNGHSGLQQARQLQPELILLDMQLPDIDGVTVLQGLKSEARTAVIPVIAVSGDAMPDQVQAARAAGCTDYWTKPLDLQRAMTALTSRFPSALH